MQRRVTTVISKDFVTPMSYMVQVLYVFSLPGDENELNLQRASQDEISRLFCFVISSMGRESRL